MKLFKKVMVGVVALLLLSVAIFLVVVGPWPVYRNSRYQSQPYYFEALAAIKAAASSNGEMTSSPLRVGWAVRDITPEAGTPMAGYSPRPNEKRSTGTRDPLFVKALAVSNGENTVVLLGADMLQTLPNLVEQVERIVFSRTPLTANNMLYHTSHSHCGPGGLAPGLAATISYGEYDPRIVTFLAERFADAAVAAYEDMAPGKFAHGAVNAPEYIKNRTRNAPADDVLHFAVFRKDSGEGCVLMRYSAHPTVFGADMLEFTGEYPGVMQREIEAATGMTAIFLGGAVGSMGPVPPSGDTDAERAEAMGAGLAEKLLDALEQPLEFQDEAVIASLSSGFEMPPFQMRPISPAWRVSNIFVTFFGVPPVGRLQAARLGNMTLVGMPYDFSGETSLEWQRWATEQGDTLWVTSHSGAYLGYLSPDRYYNEVDDHGRLDYETGLMSWFGPNLEAYMTELFQHAHELLSEG